MTWPETKPAPSLANTKAITGMVTASITAANTDHYFPEGLYYDVSIGDGDKGPHATHVAVLAVSASGTVYISEKE